ncbi:anaerobic sulfatase maturase [Persicimonas caeni]|uniref:Anaerobic sulfatase maturase n=2 Tax=Persicimonas caeni TaxID=2292766 RepID=A0A4Y6PZT2_PERCE|nr:anaerobic sulfatase maturase [Persicimonas caeni]QDG53826.1 anaerobic sulfatase maturase [Persicimonas caeni]QED35047.1 anaerobic sulfatase maturase [Persicimonas caeni]
MAFSEQQPSSDEPSNRAGGCASGSSCAGVTSRPQRPTTWPKDAPPNFHVMAKPTGAVCNLDCKYCFFLSKEALYPGSPFRMSDDVLELYISQVIEAQRSPHVTIAWQGGEPTLMGLAFFERAMELVEKYRRPQMTIEHTIQTNGTRLDEEWCAFLREHDFLVGLSIDGPRRMHDAYRVDKGGRGTFDKVARAALLLGEHGVDFNILCTVHAENASHPLEVYRFFRDRLGATFIQFIPIVERVTQETRAQANEGWGEGRDNRPLYTQRGRMVTERSVEPEQWGQFLIAVFDEWVRNDVGEVFLPQFEAALASWMRLPQSMCIFAKTCGNAVALEHNGDLYSCDHYVEPDYLLGNIRDTHMLEMLASEEQRAFGRAKEETLPQYCRDCEVRFACNGECPRNRFLETPDGEPGLNYLCAGYKAFFTHIDKPMQMLGGLLRRGRDPAEVMQILAREDASRPRRKRRRRRPS